MPFRSKFESRPRIKIAQVPNIKPTAPATAAAVAATTTTGSAYGKMIPPEIREELDFITDFTRKNDREAVVTVCQKPGSDKYFVAGYEEGDETSAMEAPCRAKFGHSGQVGTMHTHPVKKDVIGLTPSDSDLVSTLSDSYDHDRKQTDCILNHYAPYMHCYVPRQMPNKRQIENYINSMERSPGIYSDRYIVDHAGKDFDHFWYDRKTWKLIEDPTPDEIVKCAIEKSRPYIREKIETMERGAFCDFVQDLNKPRDNQVAQQCRIKLKNRTLLGIPIES